MKKRNCINKSGCLAVLMVLPLVFLSCTRGPSTPEEYIQQGRSLVAEQKYNQAVSAFTHAIEMAPESASAWSALAEAYLKLGQTTSSIDSYQHVLEIEPDNHEALLKLARFDLLGKRFHKAEVKVQKILQQESTDTEALFLLSDIYKQSSRPDLAVQVYQAIIENSPDNNEALLCLAEVLANTGNVAKAEKILQQTVAKAGASTASRLMLFNLYNNRRDYEQAEAVLKTGLEKNPENADLYNVLGIFYYTRNDTKQAEDAFRNAIKKDPDNISSYLLTGNFYRYTGDKQKSLEMYKSALELSPRNLNIMMTIAHFYLESGDISTARSYLKKITDIRPDYFPAQLADVNLLIHEKEFDAALKICDFLLKASPVSDELYRLKGLAYLKKGDLSNAEDACLRAIELSPGNINARIRLADIYLKQGQIEKADQQNREIFTLLHDNIDVDGILGSTSLQQSSKTISLESSESLFAEAATNPFGAFRMERLVVLKKKYGQMIENFEAALAKNPALVKVFETIILMHVANEDYQTAIERCEQQVDTLKNTPDIEPVQLAFIYNIKGGVYLVAGVPEKAEDAFQAAIKIAPDFLKPYYALARLYLAQKDLDKAISQYQVLLENNPDQASPHMMLGVLYKMKNDYSQAQENYEKALAINPKFAKAANNLAYLLSEQEDHLDEALRLALKAKSIDANDPYIRDTLGWVYYKMELYEDALRELKVSVNKLSNNATVNYHLGMVYYRLENSDQAKLSFKNALNLNDSFAGADNARKLLDLLK